MVAGAVCVCAALAYAEMATLIPASGSAYTYSYMVLGEILAWVVGWSLILEYTLVVSAVAVGWSGYAVGFLGGLGVHLPAAICDRPLGRRPGQPAGVAIIAVVAGLLTLGTRESATVNAVLVAVKIAALGAVRRRRRAALRRRQLPPLHALRLRRAHDVARREATG